MAFLPALSVRESNRLHEAEDGQLQRVGKQGMIFHDQKFGWHALFPEIDGPREFNE
jgi:hypothetical protein